MDDVLLDRGSAFTLDFSRPLESWQNFTPVTGSFFVECCTAERKRHAKNIPKKRQIKLIDSGVDHDLPSDAARTGADGWFSNSRVPPHGDAWFVPDQHL